MPLPLERSLPQLNTGRRIERVEAGASPGDENQAAASDNAARGAYRAEWRQLTTLELRVFLKLGPVPHSCLPAVIASGEVDGGNGSVRRLSDRQLLRVAGEVGPAPAPLEPPDIPRVHRRTRRTWRCERHDRGLVVGFHVQELLLRIVGGPTPRRAANPSRHDHGPLE